MFIYLFIFIEGMVNMGFFDKINDFFNIKKQKIKNKVEEIKVETAKDKYAYFCGIDELTDNYRLTYNSSFCNFLNKNYDGNKLHQYFMTYEINLENMGLKKLIIANIIYLMIMINL